MDFIADRLEGGRRFRVLTVIDQFTRECLKLEAAVPMSGSRVVECLERVAELRGYPQSITVDNGTEFCSRALDGWAYRKGVKLEFIRPGRPAENGFIESFNGAAGERWVSPTCDKSRVSGIVLACAEGPHDKNAQDSKYCAYTCLHWENPRGANLRESTERKYHKQRHMKNKFFPLLLTMLLGGVALAPLDQAKAILLTPENGVPGSSSFVWSQVQITHPTDPGAAQTLFDREQLPLGDIKKFDHETEATLSNQFGTSTSNATWTLKSNPNSTVYGATYTLDGSGSRQTYADIVTELFFTLLEPASYSLTASFCSGRLRMLVRKWKLGGWTTTPADRIALCELASGCVRCERHAREKENNNRKWSHYWPETKIRPCPSLEQALRLTLKQDNS